MNVILISNFRPKIFLSQKLSHQVSSLFTDFSTVMSSINKAEFGAQTTFDQRSLCVGKHPVKDFLVYEQGQKFDSAGVNREKKKYE